MDILRAKISRGFDLLDADGNGTLSEQDYVLMGRRSAVSLGYLPGSAEEARLIDAYVNIWRSLHLTHVTRADGVLGKDEFVASTLALAADPATARATVGAVAEAFFALADVTADGVVDPREYAAFLRGHAPGIPQQEIDAAFAHLDLDGDGTLSPDEFVAAVVEYWSGSDPTAPGNWAMGRPAYLREGSAV